MAQGQILPVKFIDASGAETDDYILGLPIVEIGFMYDKDYCAKPKEGTGYRNVTGYTKLSALIDTGADGIYADLELVLRHGCPFLSTTRFVGALGATGASRHTCHLWLPELSVQVEAVVTASPLQTRGQPFSIILGRRFLRLGRLDLDFQTKSFGFSLS